MKRLIGILLSVSLTLGVATLAFAQDKQDDPQKQGKGTGDSGKCDKGTGKDGNNTTKERAATGK